MTGSPQNGQPGPLPAEHPPSRRRPGAPPVAVVVPVFGHFDRLPALLGHLAAQTWQDFEVVLVDNALVPDPRVRAAANGSSIAAIRVLHSARPGSYAARNAGAAATAAEWLAFTDADCLPQPAWLEELMRRGSRADAGLLAGPVLVRPDAAPNCWAIYDTLRGIPQERYVRRGYAVTANLCLRHDLFRALGGFDGTRFSGGDAEFCRRARAGGHALVLVPGAAVEHPARSTWHELREKARRTKGGQVAAGSWQRRAAWTLRSLVPPVHEIAAYARSDHPWRWRAIAGGVRLALWGVEMAEVVRIFVLRRTPERR